MDQRIDWDAARREAFLWGRLPCGFHFSPWMIMSAVQVHCGSMHVWQDAESTDIKKGKESQKADRKSAKSQLLRASRLYNLWQEGESGAVGKKGDGEWEFWKRGVLVGGKMEKLFLRRHLALILRGSMDKPAFAACFDWAPRRKLMLFVFKLLVAC